MKSSLNNGASANIQASGHSMFLREFHGRQTDETRSEV
jgi:hypothetical protein